MENRGSWMLNTGVCGRLMRLLRGLSLSSLLLVASVSWALPITEEYVDGGLRLGVQLSAVGSEVTDAELTAAFDADSDTLSAAVSVQAVCGVTGTMPACRAAVEGSASAERVFRVDILPLDGVALADGLLIDLSIPYRLTASGSGESVNAFPGQFGSASQGVARAAITVTNAQGLSLWSGVSDDDVAGTFDVSFDALDGFSFTVAQAVSANVIAIGFGPSQSGSAPDNSVYFRLPGGFAQGTASTSWYLDPDYADLFSINVTENASQELRVSIVPIAGTAWLVLGSLPTVLVFSGFGRRQGHRRLFRLVRCVRSFNEPPAQSGEHRAAPY